MDTELSEAVRKLFSQHGARIEKIFRQGGVAVVVHEPTEDQKAFLVSLGWDGTAAVFSLGRGITARKAQPNEKLTDIQIKGSHGPRSWIQIFVSYRGDFLPFQINQTN